MKSFPVLGAAALAAFVLAAPAARAEEEGVAMKNLLGAVGILPKEKPVIEYRERPGLVVPQRLELRPPVEASSAESRVANWPKDPDVAARRRAAAESRVMQPERANRLSPEEMQAGRTTRAPRQTGSSEGPTEFTRMSPDELRAQDPRRPSSTAKQDLAYGVEPGRRALTDPPTGYRKPAANAALTPSQDAPEEANPESPDAFRREMERRR